MNKFLTTLLLTSTLSWVESDWRKLALLEHNIWNKHKIITRNTKKDINWIIQTIDKSKNNYSLENELKKDSYKNNNYSNNYYKYIQPVETKIKQKTENVFIYNHILDLKQTSIKEIRWHKVYKTWAKFNDDIAETIFDVAVVFDKYISKKFVFKWNYSNKWIQPGWTDAWWSVASLFYNEKF